MRLVASLHDVLMDESASDEFCLKRKALIGTGAGLIQRRFPLNSNNNNKKNKTIVDVLRLTFMFVLTYRNLCLRQIAHTAINIRFVRKFWYVLHWYKFR